jgi:hypothetical protein
VRVIGSVLEQHAERLPGAITVATEGLVRIRSARPSPRPDRCRSLAPTAHTKT